MKKNATPPRFRGAMINTLVDADTLIANLGVLGGWGANLVRWQLVNDPHVTPTWSYDQYLAWLDGMLSLLDQCMPTLKSSGLSVVLDMHSPIGGIDSENKWRLFNDATLQAQYVQLWQMMATRYGAEAQVIAFDIFNEPIPYTKDQWPALATTTCNAIRAIAPDKPLVVESIGAGVTQFRVLKPLPNLENIWYSAHVYLPRKICYQGVIRDMPIGEAITAKQLKSLQNSLGAIVKFQQTYNQPIYIGEFGCARWSGYDNLENRLQWFKTCINFFETQGWNWSYHAFREWQGWDLELPFDPSQMGPPSDTAAVQIMKQAFSRNRSSSSAQVDTTTCSAPDNHKN